MEQKMGKTSSKEGVGLPRHWGGIYGGWGGPYAIEEAGSAWQPTLLCSATPPAPAVSLVLHSSSVSEEAPSILLVVRRILKGTGECGLHL